MDVIEMYQSILDGRKKKLHPGTLSKKENRVKMLKYLLESVLKIDADDIPNVVTLTFLHKHKLQGLFIKPETTVYDICMEAYPDSGWKPWQFSMQLDKQWKSQSVRKEAVLWLIDKVEAAGGNQLLVTHFGSNRMAPMLSKYHGGCVRTCLTELEIVTSLDVKPAAPRIRKIRTSLKIKPMKVQKLWEKEEVPDNFWWKRSNRVEAMLWFREKYCGEMSPRAMLHAGLAGLYRFYDGNISQAMMEAREDKHTIQDPYIM